MGKNHASQYANFGSLLSNRTSVATILHTNTGYIYSFFQTDILPV